ncbi:MAG TPA: PAS domain S-box protein, partial [Vicinamibacterales bacterium]|nr:PAS domain S-box protein [Vicinamibacterales bacterium]
MALAALVPAFAIVMRDQAVERRQARDRVLQENLRLTRLAADQVASAFIGAQRFLQTFSLLPGLASFNPADCAQVAATALRDHPNFSALAMVKPDGAILCSSAGARGLRPVADRDWFRRVMRAKTSVLGEYQISQINGSPVIVVAHPIFDVAGRVQRVLALGIELGGLEQFMSTVKLGKESTISVFDRNRTIVARHPDGERWMGKSVPATQGVQRLFRSEDVDITESIGVDGVRRLYATVPVNTGFDTGLYVGIGIESTAAFAGLNQLLWQQLALLAFLSVTVIGVTLVAGQLFVVRPLDELRAVANRVASGDFSARAHLAGGVSEIRALSDAVDSMAAGLEVREREGERAAAVLRDGEARNSAILDSALDCILTIDTSGRLLDFNPAAERVFGFRRQDVIGREMAELIVPPDLREAHRAGLARYLTTGQQTVLNRRVELRAMRADGSEFPIELSIVPISIAGTQTLFTANLRDITARKEAAAAAAERARMTALTADVGVALNRHESLRASLQACAEAVVQHTGAALARIWTVNSAASVLDLQASAGLYTHVNGAHARIPVGQFEIGRIARDRKPTLTNQVIGDADVHDQEWARREGMVAFAGYPLMIGEQVVGVIALFARHKLAEPVLTTLGSIADHLALGTRRHHAEEGQRIQARQLERTEAEFRSLFAANPLPMWVYEIATWQFLEVNDAAVERYG